MASPGTADLSEKLMLVVMITLACLYRFALAAAPAADQVNNRAAASQIAATLICAFSLGSAPILGHAGSSHIHGMA